MPLTGAEIQSYGAGFGQTLSFGCYGNEMEIRTCDLSRIGSYNHTGDSGVVCGRRVNCCDLGSNHEDCLEITASTGSEQVSSQETATVLPITDTAIMSSASSCSDEIFGSLLGILIALLIGVICGWMVTCFVLSRKLKESKTSKNRYGTCDTR